MIKITKEIKQKIYDLYNECIENLEPFHRKLDSFIVPDTLAQLIMKETTIDVAGHWVCIDNYGITHALEHHGKPVSEGKRGQAAVEKEDFIKMLDVFLQPDEIQFIGKTKKTQRLLLQFIRQIDDKIYVVKEVRTITSQRKNKISRLVFHTMYKKIKPTFGMTALKTYEA